jgi:glycosidase
MRIDAAKHYSASFQKEFVHHLRNTVGTNYVLMGEYWRGEVDLLLGYLRFMEYEVSLFDVPLLGRFAAISKMAGGDLRKIFKGSLVEQSPKHAVVRLHQDVKIDLYLTCIQISDICRESRYSMLPSFHGLIERS